MRTLLHVCIFLIAGFGIFALMGIWAAHNVKPTHNPSVLIADYIKSTGGNWPSSWKQIEKAGFKIPPNHERILVAWDVDPVELLEKGKVAGVAAFHKNSCMVVYLQKQKPEGQVDWLLQPWIADALKESRQTKQSETDHTISSQVQP